MPKVVSLTRAVAAAKRNEANRLKQLPQGSISGIAPPREGSEPVSTQDSFQNFQHKLGIGTDNPLSSSTYGFNPITRVRTLLEWMHRGSWIAGRVVDCVADDMTREGVEIMSEMDPEEQEELEAEVTSLNVWPEVNDTIRWGRLYGGCLSVALIDGQSLRTPLRIEAVGEGQFKGLITLDRWMVSPDLSDLVTELGPFLGTPKYYRIEDNAPALRGQVIHYSRVMVRHVGVKLPYQQRLMENLWGLSVLERLYDRMIGFDSASTGAAQLVYKAYLRLMSVDGLRDVVGAGGPALDGLTKYIQMMTRFQGIEGMTLIDSKDKFEGITHTAFSGMSQIIDKLGEQLSGASEIPLTRLFGQAPSGLNNTDDSSERNYNATIHQRQMTDLHGGITKIYRLAAASRGIKLEESFKLKFKSLKKLDEKDKSDIAKTNMDTITGYINASLMSDQVAMKEVKQQSRITGIGTNITDKDINDADDTIPDPMEMGEMNGQNLTQPQAGSVAPHAGAGSTVRPAAPASGEGGRVDPTRPES